MWFIAYRHPLRPGEAGVKFAGSKAEAIAEGQRWESLGYVSSRKSGRSALATTRKAAPSAKLIRAAVRNFLTQIFTKNRLVVRFRIALSRCGFRDPSSGIGANGAQPAGQSYVRI